MDYNKMQFPPKRPIPQMPTAQKEEGVDAAKEDLKKQANGGEDKSRDMLFGVLGGLSLIMAIVCFVLMFVL